MIKEIEYGYMELYNTVAKFKDSDLSIYDIIARIDYCIANFMNDDCKTVIGLIYGLDDGKQRSLAEVGRMIGWSRSRVGDIRDKALRSFHSPCSSIVIRSGVDKHLEFESRAKLAEKNMDSILNQTKDFPYSIDGDWIKENYRDARLDCTAMPARTANILRHYGVKTVNDIINMDSITYYKVLNDTRVGKKTVNDINSFIDSVRDFEISLEEETA